MKTPPSGLIRFVFLLFGFLALLVPLASNAAPRPNILLMMVDDLGYSDFGCYGSEINTPNIDKLAADGLRFSRFYNTAKCHSSRVSLLTGLYCDQAGSNALNRGVTIAEVLKKAGYSTAMVGKWHLDKQPTDRGFQRYFGHLSGATNFFTGDNTFRLNGEPWNAFGKDFYTTDAWGEYGIRFLDEMLETPDKPFFLYVAHNAPHYPLHAHKEDVEKYDGVYDAGWDAIRKARQAKQLELGLVPKTWEPAPRPPNVPAWTELSEQQQALEARKMAAFAAMVDRVDQVTGTLIAHLKAKGVFDNTLIFLCSDNGACPFNRTRGVEFEPWDPRSYWCYDTGWSHVGNTPFRLHKQNQHEGGISSPMIAHWPAGLTANMGSITAQPGHLIDFMATAIDVADTTYPASWPGIDLEPLQGKSLLPILKGERREPHAELFFHFGENRGMREGQWKLVTHRRSRWELYNIDEDGTERHDLAKKHPEIVERMSTRWYEWADKTNKLKGKARAPMSNKPPPFLQKGGNPAKAKTS